MSAPLAAIEHRGDITVATVTVEIDLANVAQIYEELLRGVGKESRGLVVDLTGVNYFDSAGVRSFFDLARELHIARQSLGIVVPTTSPLRRLVKITRLDEAAVLTSSVDECVAALRGPTPAT